MTLTDATNITTELHARACQIFDRLWDGRPICQLGIHTGKLRDKGDMRQIHMFDPTDHEKLERMDAAVDKIRGRYGIDAVKRAVFLENCHVDHMSGGISREKRTVYPSSVLTCLTTRRNGTGIRGSACRSTRAGPVSYTHLDVYKRQRLLR